MGVSNPTTHIRPDHLEGREGTCTKRGDDPLSAEIDKSSIVVLRHSGPALRFPWPSDMISREPLPAGSPRQSRLVLSHAAHPELEDNGRNRCGSLPPVSTRNPAGSQQPASGPKQRFGFVTLPTPHPPNKPQYSEVLLLSTFSSHSSSCPDTLTVSRGISRQSARREKNLRSRGKRPAHSRNHCLRGRHGGRPTTC